MSSRRFRRWLVPSAVVSSLVAPLVIGGCFDAEDLPFGLAGCQWCVDCYEDITGMPPADLPDDDLPEEFQFRITPPADTGLVSPGGSADGGTENSGEEDTGNEESYSDKTPRGRPTGIPDGVLRPRPDHPNLPDLPETPNLPNYPSKPSSPKNYKKN